MQCTGCGFDGSQDYESYPSLSRVAPAVATVAHRRNLLRKKQDHILSCPSCGGGLFSVDFENQTYICSNCGCRFSRPEEKDSQTLKETKTAEKKQKTGSEKHKPVLRLSKLPKRRQGEETTPRRGKLETCILWMGFLLLCVLSLCLFAITGSEESTVPYGCEELVSMVTIMIVFMECNLWEKGFTCPKWLKWMWEWWCFDTTKVKGVEWFLLYMVVWLTIMPLDLLKFLYFFMVFGGGIFGAVRPFSAIADLVCGNSSLLETTTYLALSISFLYIALWHIGKLCNR